MIASARSLTCVLTILSLSGRLDAFISCPNARCNLGYVARRPSAVMSPTSVRRGSLLARYRGPERRARCTGSLRMADEEVPMDVEVADLEEREFQLEELEDRDVAATSIVLKKDGSVEAGTTNGPLPLSARGTWSYSENKFKMEISREFDAAIPYTVSRVYTGTIDEVLPATDTIIVAGDIVMEEMDVGYFKMISAPSDILDSLEHVDEKMAQRAAQ